MYFPKLTIFFVSLVQITYACTDFLIQATDGSVINGRSMEFGANLQSNIMVFPRNESVLSKAPDGKSGIRWTSKFGFLALTAFETDIVVDGLNEKGLSYGALWLPGTEYQVVPLGKNIKALDFADIGTWILGNFSTVAEVKEAIKEVFVWGHSVAQIAGIPPLHFTVHDVDGNSLVIEYVKGALTTYDNPNGVMTNFPTFDWHLLNLNNYINLSAVNAAPLQLKGLTLGGKFQGSGLLGIPGDWMPSSRFVRVTILKNFAMPPDNALEGVNLAAHLLNSVDIPLGNIRDKPQIGATDDHTQWVVIKDLSSKMLYFRSYSNLSIKAVNLKKLDFSPGAVKKNIPIDMGEEYEDVTSSLQSPKKT